MTPNQYRREGFQAGIEAAKEACADYPRTAPDETEWTHYDEQIAHSQACIRAIDVDKVLAKLRTAPDAVAQPASSCPPPQHGDETYYSKGKTAEWWVGLTDEQFAWELICATQDLNDTGLGDDLDKWMPHQVMLADAANRIKRLSAPAPDAVVRLVKAARAGLNYLENTEDEFGITLGSSTGLRAALAAMETSHD